MSQNFVIVGTSGSGKSTLARAIARKLNITHIELDAINHLANWTPNPNFESELGAVLDSAENWVVDGNYENKGAQKIVWPQANTLIWLDYPKSLTLWRITKRSFKRSILREKLWNGNQESLRDFLQWHPHSMFYWVWTTHAKRRQQYLTIMQSPQWQHISFVQLSSPQQTKQWLNQLN